MAKHRTKTPSSRGSTDAERKIIELVENGHFNPERLQNMLDEMVVSGNKKRLQAGFAALFSHTLRHYGFSPDRRGYHKLAGRAAHWQDDGRMIPYDPLLVQSWFDGSNIPEEAAWQSIYAHFSDHEKTTETQRKALEMLDTMYGALSTNRFEEAREASEKIIEELGYEYVAYLAKDLSAIIRNPVYRVFQKDVHKQQIESFPKASTINGVLAGSREASANFQSVICDALEALYQQKRPNEVTSGLDQLKDAFAAINQGRAQHASGASYPHASEVSRTADLRISTLCQRESAEPARSIAKKNSITATAIATELGLLSPNGSAAKLTQRCKGTSAFQPEELKQLDAIFEREGMANEPPLTALYFHQAHTRAQQSWQAAEQGDTPFGKALVALRESVGWKQAQLASAWAAHEAPNAPADTLTKVNIKKRSLLSLWEGEKKCSSTSTLHPSTQQLKTLTGLLLEEQQRLAKEYGANFTPFITQEKLDTLSQRRNAIADPQKIHMRPSDRNPPDTRILDRTIVEPLLHPNHPDQPQKPKR